MTEIGSFILPETAAALRKAITVYQGNEIFFGCLINEQGLVYEYTILSRGSRQAAPVVFEQACRYDAVLHNHPSARLDPSAPDLEIAGSLGNYGVAFYITDNDLSRINVVIPYTPPAAVTPLEASGIKGVFREGGKLSEFDPGYEVRPSQLRMADGVSRAFNDDLVYLCEAATGTGKSLAYLIPAVQWAALNREKVVVSTNTINLQEQLAGKDIPLALRAAEADLVWAVVKGRGNYLCLRKYKNFCAEQSGAQRLFSMDDALLAELAEWVTRTKTGDRSELAFVPDYILWESISSGADTCLRARCPHQDKCFYQQVRRDAFKADILVVNHHILCADLAIKREAGNYNSFALLPAFKRLIIDEAHNIEEVATSYFGKKASAFAVSRSLGLLSGPGLKKKGKAGGVITVLQRRITQLSQDNVFLERTAALIRDYLAYAIKYYKDSGEIYALLNLYVESQVKGPSGREKKLRFKEGFEKNTAWQAQYRAPLNNLIELLEKMKSVLYKFVKTVKAQLSDEELDRILFDFSAYAERLAYLSGVYSLSLEKINENEIKWAQTAARKGYIRFAAYIAPLFTGRELYETVYKNLATVVLTSATISDGSGFTFFKERSGLDLVEDYRLQEVSLPFNFDYHRNCAVNLPADMPLVNSPDFLSAAADGILSAAAVFKGRMFVLCTSYQQLNALEVSLEDKLAALGITLLVQGREPRTALISRMRASPRHLLLGVSSFWEGVDIRGENLSCLIMLKLPFAVPSEPLYEARVEQLQKAGRNPFNEYSVPQAVLKFKQGFGRLIRSAEDKGLFCIYDQRVLTKSYGRSFIAALPKMHFGREKDPAAAASLIFPEEFNS